jgi:hypothetical protein
MAPNDGEGSSPLLSKNEHRYHPGCPACDHDRRKDLQTGMPYKEFLYVWMICLTTGTVPLLLSLQPYYSQALIWKLVVNVSPEITKTLGILFFDEEVTVLY